MEKELLERVSACALNRISGYEPLTGHRLIRQLGSASAVFSLSSEDLRDLLGPYNRFTERITQALQEECFKELERLEAKGCVFLPFSDPDYPDALRECPDAPLGLYVCSASPPGEIFNKKTNIGIVGTRDCSLYGKEWCTRIVESISQSPSKPVIVSGLAYGIDITAHRAALDCGLPTIAVLPTGIEEIYPSRHRADARRIAKTPGCAVITDYPPGTAPQAVTFLRRNRIIAGLCSGLVLVESKVKGGGMITAKMAFDYGRDVFSLPGRIDDLRSGGCNLLLKQKIAEPVTDTGELCEALGLGSFKRRKKKDLLEEVRSRYSEDVSPGEMDAILEIVQAVKAERGISLDELCRKTCTDYSDLSRRAMMLQSDSFLDIDLMQRCSIHPKNV